MERGRLGPWPQLRWLMTARSAMTLDVASEVSVEARLGGGTAPGAPQRLLLLCGARWALIAFCVPAPRASRS